MEQQIIDTINKAKNLLDNYECKLTKHMKENNLSWNIFEEGLKKQVCENCLLYQTNLDVYDTDHKCVEINICTLLDVMNYIES